jgi:8-oxo-dGTP diphosphatase
MNEVGNMRNTTICYIERDNKYLMLHRIKKDASVDPSHNKWIGVGGKFEKDESPDECIIRETKEETGLELISPKLRGIATFISDEWETEYMFIFTADNFSGDLAEDCNEGNLKWIPKDEVMDLPVWEGDKIFLKLLIDDAPFFLLKLVYEGEKLVKYTLN